MRLIPALAEAARATQRTTERFVPPRAGIVEEAAARRHQFVLGRRGVGKSTLLRVVERRVIDGGGPVAFIDLETLRGVPYPDVLIQLLVELLGRLDARLKAIGAGAAISERYAYWRQRRRLRRLSRSLSQLLSEPQSAEHVVQRLRKRAKSAGGEGVIGIPFMSQRTQVNARAQLESAEQVQT